MNYIFDFDGTIADSFFVINNVANEILSDYGREPVTPEQIEKFRGMSIIDGIKHLGIPKRALPKLVTKGKAAVKARMDQVKPVEGMPELLEKLHKDGATLGVLTSNDKEVVDAWLREHGLRDYFTFVQGGASLFGKAPKIKRIIKDYSLDQSQTFYIGDEVRDVEASKKANVKVIAVTWGMNNQEILKIHGPDVLAILPTDIVQ